MARFASRLRGLESSCCVHVYNIKSDISCRFRLEFYFSNYVPLQISIPIITFDLPTQLDTLLYCTLCLSILHYIAIRDWILAKRENHIGRWVLVLKKEYI